MRTSTLIKQKIIVAIGAHQTSEPIRPEDIADKVQADLDDDQIRETSNFFLRQIARSVLRRPNKPKGNNKQLSFPDFPLLQEHYPLTQKASGYVLLKYLPQPDWSVNIYRLRGKGHKELAHADQLYEWGIKHFGLKDTLPKGGQL